jgi:hypothetical protein
VGVIVASNTQKSTVFYSTFSCHMYQPIKKFA